MNILFLTPRLPYFPDTGAKIRTWNLLLQVKKCGDNVNLLSFLYDKEDIKMIDVIKNVGIKVFTVEGKDKISAITVLRSLILNLPLTVAKYRNRRMEVLLKDIIENHKIDIVHFDHIHMSQYASCCEGIPTVIDEHNVESVILRRYAERETNFLKKLILKSEYRKMGKFERMSCLKASKVFVVSENDRNTLVGLCGNGINPEIIPNGVDTNYFSPPSNPHPTPNTLDSTPSTLHPTPFSIVFTGSLDWFPNEDGLIYFFTEIYPLIKREVPQVNITVVGRNPSRRLLQFARNDKSINIVGRVDDVRTFIANAKVFVVPLRIGGGTRLKILEAMASGVPVVSTSIGAEGLMVEEGRNILIANNPEEFAQRVVEVIDNKQIADLLSQAGRKFVEQNYDWRIIGGKLKEVYRKAVDNVK